MTLRNIDIITRPFELNELPFLLETWLESYRKTELARYISNYNYYKDMPRYISDIIQENTTKIVIQCDKKDPSDIIGFLVYDDTKNYIHYVYTRPELRRFKLATNLITSIYSKDKWDDIKATFYCSFFPFKYINNKKEKENERRN